MVYNYVLSGLCLQLPVQIVQVEKPHTMNPHTMNPLIKLRANEVLYIIEKPEGEWWFGMTHDGLTGYFMKDCVGELKAVTPDGTRHVCM